MVNLGAAHPEQPRLAEPVVVEQPKPKQPIDRTDPLAPPKTLQGDSPGHRHKPFDRKRLGISFFLGALLVSLPKGCVALQKKKQKAVESGEPRKSRRLSPVLGAGALQFDDGFAEGPANQTDRLGAAQVVVGMIGADSVPFVYVGLPSLLVHLVGLTVPEG